MFKWWHRFTAQADHKTYVRGYDYAVGTLLRGEKTEDQLLRETETTLGPGDYELGMRAGISDLKCRETRIRMSTIIQHALQPNPKE